MAKATLGDAIKVYIKPSLKGELVIRKPTSSQKSSRLHARQEAFKAAAEAGRISKAAHEALVAKGKCPTQRVYKTGVGYEERPVCPIQLMRSALSTAVKQV